MFQQHRKKKTEPWLAGTELEFAMECSLSTDIGGSSTTPTCCQRDAATGQAKMR